MRESAHDIAKKCAVRRVGKYDQIERHAHKEKGYEKALKEFKRVPYQSK